MLMYPFGYNKVAIFLRKKNYKIFTHFPLKIFNFINSTLLPHKSTFLWSKCLLYWNSWNTLQMLIAFGLTPFPSRTLSPISHWKFMEQYSLQSTFNAMFYPCSWIANAGSISFELAGVKSGKAGIEFCSLHGSRGVNSWAFRRLYKSTRASKSPRPRTFSAPPLFNVKIPFSLLSLSLFRSSLA